MSILVSVQQVVPLFPNLVHFPKIGDNDVTAGGKILKIFKNCFDFWIFHLQNVLNTNFDVCMASSSAVP